MYKAYQPWHRNRLPRRYDGLLTTIHIKPENQENNLKNNYLLLLALATLVLGGGELLVRSLGMVDFPLYEANALIGYIPAANQKGSFLNSHDWQFNEKHMGAGAFVTSAKSDVLLVGGNPLGEVERLGPQLAKVTSQSVWPISAGSWALRNELAY